MDTLTLVAVFSGFGLSLTAPWLHRIGRGATGWLIALLPFGLALYFLSLVGSVAAGDTIRVSYPWVPTFGINLSFVIDGLGLMYALLITGIGTLIMIYAGGYLAGHPQLGRFFAFILLFLAAMLGVVLSDNLLVMFVFWELTSISSYLLIGFKHADEKSRKSALQALLVTGSGGLALLAGVILLRIIGGSWEISVLANNSEAIRSSPLYLGAFILIVLGAFTKSAQFPFHFWLPGAMAAPTPVSAYLHSATMVKVGIYLLARLNPVMGDTVIWQTTLVAVGATTMAYTAYLAILQTDLKRILAYSTVSALGTLTLLIGIGTTYALEAAMMFLFSHALYKGALFMAAGTIEHETGTRDITQLGGLFRSLPIIGVATGVAALSMAGMIPMAGFIGKELFYKATVEAPSNAVLLTSIAVASNILIVVVAGMVGIKPFFGAKVQTPQEPHTPPISLWLGPAVLASLSLLAGLLPDIFTEPIVGPATNSLQSAPTDVDIYLWPGFNFVLALSAATVALGSVVYAGRGVLQPAITRLAQTQVWGPERGYNSAVDGLNALARLQTRILQSGYLRYYLMLCIITMVGFVGFTLISGGALSWPTDVSSASVLEIIFAALILLAAIFMVRTASRLAAVVGLGVIGFSIALIFLINGGPDLAMTQFAVETLSVILFVFVLYRLPRFVNYSRTADRIRDAIIAFSAGGLITAFILAVTTAPLVSRVTDFYAENSYTLAYGRNIVNVILVDFRSLDTLGELVVLAIAAIGVYTLIALRPCSEQDSESSATPGHPETEA